MPAIEAAGLTKRWGSFAAVDDLDLSVDQGECYAFLGRNGAGKSTTARMLLDFLRPASGTVRVLGGSGSDPAIRARIGYLPGDLNLPAKMTGHEAVHFFGSIGHRPDTAKVDELTERLGLTPNRPFHQLSTGNRRKVGLVLAFMNDPDLLILDEPKVTVSGTQLSLHVEGPVSEALGRAAELVGGLSALAVAFGSGAIAYFIGAATGHRSYALGISSGIAVAGYVLYTLSNVTGDLEALTWFSPWRWFIDDAMMVNGLTADILWPIGLTTIAVVAGWQLFVRRDLQN